MKPGFTLLETMLYMVLLGLILGGVLLTTYSLIESEGRSQTQLVLDDEGTFVMEKIRWLLARGVVVVTPDSGQDTRIVVQGASRADVIALSNGTVLWQDNGVTQPLTNDGTVTNFVADRRDDHTLAVQFELSARTPNGFMVSASFSQTFFLAP